MGLNIIAVATGWAIGIGAIALVVGLVVGFFVARRWFKRYLEKNPPVNEQMIREMMRQMGRTPSEKQVKQIINSMNQYK
ncbi:MAG: YneF family protein [Acholeplasma sp.]|nr:YneF family protein [Acholeplasma sp.]